MGKKKRSRFSLYRRIAIAAIGATMITAKGAYVGCTFAARLIITMIDFAKYSLAMCKRPFRNEIKLNRLYRWRELQRAKRSPGG